MLQRLSAIAIVAGVLSASACHGQAIDIGIKNKKMYKASVVADGLCNPSCVTFSPDGHLTICDSGNGNVLVMKDGKAEKFLTGFETEFWKTNADTGAKSFKLGPLSAVWVGKQLAVTNAGLGDGKETVVFFNGPGNASSGKATNSVGPTSDDPKDKGEGNLTGLSVTEDGSTVFVAGQGADAKTWVLKVDVASKKLSGAFSADDAGIAINSPMATMPWNKTTVLALYSGKGGADDGLIVQWNIKTGKVAKKWSLPGLTDPMGFARVPETGQVVVVDNNWSLTEVKPGRLARVTLPRKDSAEAKVRVIADNLHGPVSCAFGPDGNLYVAQLGSEFDSNKGQVISVSGIKKFEGKKKKKKKDADK